MAKAGRKYGASRISLSNNLTARGNGSQWAKTNRRSTRGKYRIVFTKSYTNVSSRDVQLKLDYAKDLLYQNIGIKSELLQFREKQSVQSLTARSTVYTVYRGKEVIGQMAISIHRLGKRIGLDYVYSEKKAR